MKVGGTTQLAFQVRRLASDPKRVPTLGVPICKQIDIRNHLHDKSASVDGTISQTEVYFLAPGQGVRGLDGTRGAQTHFLCGAR
jgi:hypothetical protein